jgi:hypothetical protein
MQRQAQPVRHHALLATDVDRQPIPFDYSDHLGVAADASRYRRGGSGSVLCLKLYQTSVRMGPGFRLELEQDRGLRTNQRPRPRPCPISGLH